MRPSCSALVRGSYAVISRASRPPQRHYFVRWGRIGKFFRLKGKILPILAQRTKNAVGCNLRSALAKRPLTSSLTKKQGGKTPRNRLDMGASRTYFSVIFVLSAHLVLIKGEPDVHRPGQRLCLLRRLGTWQNKPVR